MFYATYEGKLTAYIGMESFDVFVLSLFKFISDLLHSAVALFVFKGPSPPTLCLSVETSFINMYFFLLLFLGHRSNL